MGEVQGWDGNLKTFSVKMAEVLLDFPLTVKAAPHECVIRTSQL